MKAKKSLTIIFPRGETLSNFLTEDFINILSKNFKINIVVYSKAHLLLFSKQIDYVDSVIEIKPKKSVAILNFLHMILDFAHNIWINTKASNDRIQNKINQSSNYFSYFKARFLILFAKLFANKIGLELLESLNENANKLLNFERYIEDHFNNYKPDLVFCTSHIHNFNCLNWIYAAKRRGVPTTAFIFSWDNVTSQGRIIPKYDNLFTWNEDAKSKILDFYPNHYLNRIQVTGTPQFDGYFSLIQNKLGRKEFCEIYGLNPARPIFYYTTGMAHHMPGEPILVKNILESFSQFPIENRPQLLLRIYPKDFTNRFQPLFGSKDLFIQDSHWEKEALLPTPHAQFILRESLRNIDLGINIASTITLELLMFCKPVINIAYTPKYKNDDKTEMMISKLEREIYSEKQLKYLDFVDNLKWYSFEHYKDVAESGCVKLCYSFDDLKDAILNYNKIDKNEIGKIELFNKKFSNTLDGLSYSRIANEILKTVQKK
jgi:hypothetical protein